MYNVTSLIEPPPTYQIGPTFSIGLKIPSFTRRPVKNEKNETSLVASARNTSNQNVCIQELLCLCSAGVTVFHCEHRPICKLVSSHISCEFGFAAALYCWIRYTMSPYICGFRLRLVKLKSRINRIWRLNRLQHRQGESTTH